MMDAVTLMIVCFTLLPSTGFGKPVVTDTASFILKAPDNDTGIWMWKTANSKVSFRHFHHVGDNTGKGYWTLEVTHSETVPKHVMKTKDVTESQIGPKRSQKARELTPEPMSSNSIGKIPYIMLVNAPNTPTDVFQEQKRVTTSALPVETDKSSSELLEEFLEGVKETQRSEPLIAATDLKENLEKVFIQHDGEQDDAEKEENWWLPGEDLVDEEEDGYFHVRDITRVKLYALHKDWSEARKKCRRDGGDLAVPDTVLKARVILKLLHRYPDIPASAVLRNQVYVGIHDPLHHRDWITVKGDGFKEDFWAPGEPDNETPGEDCVTFRTDGKIRDVPCFYSLPFVCEKPLPPSEQYRQSYLD